MNTPNKQLANQALETLKGQWGLAIGTGLLFMLLTGILSAAKPLGSLASLVISGPLMLGYVHFNLAMSRKEEARVEQLFQGFNNFGTALVAYLLQLVYIILWALLLLVPGIIKAIAYSQTFYIIAENPTIKPMDALQRSEKLMDGYKLKFFYLTLRFLGWAILCIFTMGIGFLWLVPYMWVSFAKFYDDIKDRQLPD